MNRPRNLLIALLLLGLVLLGDVATSAGAAPGIGVGAVLIVPHDFDRQLSLLRTMRADTVRLHVFYDPHVRYQVFDAGHVRALRDIGVTTVILRTGEAVSWQDALWQLDQFAVIARAVPGVRYVWEIGNEPNLAGKDAYAARYDLLQTIRHARPRYADLPVTYAAGLSTVYDTRGALEDVYFDRLVRDAGDGLGSILTAYDSAAVHGYGYHSLHRLDGAAPWAVYDWVRGWDRDIPIYFTEAGIDGERWPDKARGLVVGALDAPADVRAMVYFTISPDGSWPTYAITPEGAAIIGER